MQTPSKLINPTSIGSIAAILWGTIATIVRIVSAGVGPLYSVAIIHGMAAILGICLYSFRGDLPKLRLITRPSIVAFRALIFPIQTLAFCLSIALVDKEFLPLALLINYLWPSLTLVFTVILQKTKIPRPILFYGGLLVVFFSITWELLHGFHFTEAALAKNNVTAFFGMAIAALCWSIYSAITRKFGEVSGGSVILPFFSLLTATTAGIFALGGFDPLPPAHYSFHPAFLLGGTVNFIAYLCWDYGTRKGNIIILSLCADALPWLTLATVHFMLGVPLSWHNLGSALLLVMGALLTRYGTR